MTVDATSQAESKPPDAPVDDLRRSRRGPASGAEAPTHSAPHPALTGELRRPPRSALGTLLLGATGLLVLGHVLAVLGRLTLGLRRPATLEVTPRGIRIEQRTMLLGRVLRARETLVPLDALLRVTREIRFARSGLYVGLAMLALGTYFGVGFLVDGIRAPGGSPSLLFMGLVVMIVGLALDFGLSSLADGARGRCQVTVIPVRGRALCVGALEPERADATLRRVASQLGIEPEHPELNAQRLVEEIKDQASQSFLARGLGSRKDSTQGALRAVARPSQRSSAESKPAGSPQEADTASDDDAGEDALASEPERGSEPTESRREPRPPMSSDDPVEQAANDDEHREGPEQKAQPVQTKPADDPAKAEPIQPASGDDPAPDAAGDKVDSVAGEGRDEATDPAEQNRDRGAAAKADRDHAGNADGDATESRNGEGKQADTSSPTGVGAGDPHAAAETSLGSESTRRLGSGTTEGMAGDEPAKND